jgi:hypothetical protein
MLQIVVWHGTVYLLHHFLGLLVFAPLRQEAWRLGDDEEDDDGEADEEPHRVDGMAPLADGHL